LLLPFARPNVLSAARVKENCFSLSFIAAPSCQTWRRASTGKLCRVSRSAQPRSRLGPDPRAKRPPLGKAPPSRPAKESPSVCQHVFVIGHRVHIPTRFVGVGPCGAQREPHTRYQELQAARNPATAATRT
jgi:hypothetical protein